MADLNATPMIEALGLSKFYGSFAAVREVSFISGADSAKLRLRGKDVVR